MQSAYVFPFPLVAYLKVSNARIWDLPEDILQGISIEVLIESVTE